MDGDSSHMFDIGAGSTKEVQLVAKRNEVGDVCGEILYTIQFAASTAADSIPSWITNPLEQNKLSLTPALTDEYSDIFLKFDATYNDGTYNFVGTDLGPDIFDYLTISVIECMVTSVMASTTTFDYYKGTSDADIAELSFTPTP